MVLGPVLTNVETMATTWTHLPTNAYHVFTTVKHALTPRLASNVNLAITFKSTTILTPILTLTYVLPCAWTLIRSSIRQLKAVKIAQLVARSALKLVPATNVSHTLSKIM